MKHVQYTSIRDWTTESSSWVCSILIHSCRIRAVLLLALFGLQRDSVELLCSILYYSLSCPFITNETIHGQYVCNVPAHMHLSLRVCVLERIGVRFCLCGFWLEA